MWLVTVDDIPFDKYKGISKKSEAVSLRQLLMDYFPDAVVRVVKTTHLK